MKRLIVISFISLSSTLILAQKPVIYLIPGQGSDYRIYNNLEIDTAKYDTVKLHHLLPDKKESMNSFARKYAAQIDTNSSFIIIGMSLGGMISTEIASFTNPDKVIIISSAKCRKELPGRYKFMKYIPIYKLIPAGLYKFGSKFMQPLVEPDRKHEKETFKTMLSAKDPKFIKRTVGIIVKWDRTEYSDKIVHIHGTKDHTLPYRKVKKDYTIENGSHMMTLTRGKEISVIINDILED